MEVQIFIFNYAHFKKALDLFSKFSDSGYDTYIINCKGPNDPNFKGNDKIIMLPNVFYSGQWNEALKLLKADVALFVNSDVTIPKLPRVMDRLKKFYNSFGDNAGIYSPNVSWTPWTYNPKLLPEIGIGFKQVPGTDSVIWSVCKSIALKVGQIDLSTNKFGWGIELVAAYYCSLESKFVVRDYLVKCRHPKHTSYSRSVADREWKNMIGKMNLPKDFWSFYNSRSKYQFGWRGNYKIEPIFEKMNL